MINSRRFSEVQVRRLLNDIRPLDPEIQGQTKEMANPHRIRTYRNGGSNSFRMRTYGLLDLKSFRMRTYETNHPARVDRPERRSGARELSPAGDTLTLLESYPCNMRNRNCPRMISLTKKVGEGVGWRTLIAKPRRIEAWLHRPEGRWSGPAVPLPRTGRMYSRQRASRRRSVG